MRAKAKPKTASPRKLPAGGWLTRRREWLLLGLILLVGLGLRWAYLAEAMGKPDFDSPLSDAQYNDYWARGLAFGDWTPPTGEPDPQIPATPYFRPPGYPWFLALIYWLCGPGYLAPRLVQMAIGLVNVVLAWRLGRAVFNRHVGLVAAGLLAVYWSLVYFEAEFHPKPLLILLILVLLMVSRRWALGLGHWWAAGCGLLLGLLALVRPNVLLFVPVLLAWMAWVLWRRQVLRRLPAAAGALIGLLLLTISPATIRNYLVSRDFVLISTNGGINLYIGNNPLASLTTPRLPDIEKLTGRSGWGLFLYPEIVKGLEAEAGHPLKHSEASRIFSRRARDFIWSHPGTALGNLLRRAYLMWGPHEVSNNKVDEIEHQRSPILRWIPGFPMVVSGFLLGLGLWLLDRRRVRASNPASNRPDGPEAAVQSPADAAALTAVLMVLLALVYSLSFAPFLVAGRFRVPYTALLLLFAAYGLWRLGGFAVERRWPAVLGTAGAWAALWVAASFSYVPYQPDLGTWYLDRATACMKRGRLDQAIAEYKAATEANPRFPVTFADLGAALVKKGDFDAAVASFRKAIELSPTTIEFRRRLADVLRDLARVDEAIAEYRAAAELSPSDGELWYTLGRLLVGQKADAEAIKAYRRAVEASPELVEARVNLGALLQQQGDLDGAIREYRLALGTDPNRFEAHYNLGGALWAKGDLDQAIREVSLALNIQPSNPAAIQTLKSLQEQRQQRSTTQQTRPAQTTRPAEPTPP